MLLPLNCLVHLTECYYHVPDAFQIESTLYSCLNVKELLIWHRHNTWSSSESNMSQTHNHSVFKQTLNHLAKLAKWLSCVVSTYLDGAFDYVIIMSCTHFRVNLHSIIAWMFVVSEFMWQLHDSSIGNPK